MPSLEDARTLQPLTADEIVAADLFYVYDVSTNLPKSVTRDELKEVFGDDLPTYDDEPTNYSAPDPAAATHSTATYAGAGAAGSLVLTTRDPYAGSDDYDLVLIDPLIESQALALEDSVATKTCTVYLATDAGSAATATLSNGTVVTYGTAGAAGNEENIVLRPMVVDDIFGGQSIFPGQGLSAEITNGTSVIVNLATGTGTSGELVLAESSNGAGQLTITNASGFVGSWVNDKVRAKVQFSGISSPFGVGVELGDTLDITVDLATDADGLPVAIDSISLAQELTDAIGAWQTGGNYGNLFEVTDDTTGEAQVETAVAVGTATSSGTITVTVTGALVGNSPKAIEVEIAENDTAPDWAAKVRTALAMADITDHYTIGGSGANISLTTNATVHAANDPTLNIAIADTDTTGITADASSNHTNAGVATGVFNTYQAFVSMTGGVDAAPNDAANTAALIEAAITGTGIATATGGTGPISAYETVDFSGGGESIAITTTLTQLKAALNATEGGSALIIAGTLSNGSTLCTDTTVTLTGGKDVGEDAAEVLGTPAHLGRLATDGTDVWMALKEDPTTTQDGWVKIFTPPG